MTVSSFKIDPPTLPPFAGNGPDTFTFLGALPTPEDREWINANSETC